MVPEYLRYDRYETLTFLIRQYRSEKSTEINSAEENRIS